MQETLLLMELEAQEFCVDLRSLSQLVLSDLGATLHVFRMARCEYGAAEGAPIRVEDCIAAIGVQVCLDAMSARVSQYGGRSNAIAELWRHSSQTARRSKQIAERTRDIDPAQAYLVGLCHSMESLEAVLGWNGSSGARVDGVRMGLALCREWRLPHCVGEYFSDLQENGVPSPWVELVRAAHIDGEDRSTACALASRSWL
jgi:HD-like signal output (HDOD) protein